MGQKVNPHGLRVGITKNWESKWYADDSDFVISEGINNLKIGRVKSWYTLIKAKPSKKCAKKNNLNSLAKKSVKGQSMRCQMRYNIRRKLIA